MASTNNWKNVNNWHWVEKDYSTASKDFIATLSLLEDYSNCISEASFEGEYTANVRKGKIIMIYDYKLSLTMKVGCETKKIEADVDSADDDSYKRGISLGDALTVKKVVEALNLEIESKARNDLLGNASNNQPVYRQNLETGPSIHTTSRSNAEFTFEWIFYCPFNIVVDCLIGKMFTMWSRSANSSGVFSLQGGLIQYKMLDSSDNVLKLLWKLKDWTNYSNVTITGETSGSQTLICLTQTDITSDFASDAVENWETYFWKPISIVTGIGYEKQHTV